MGQPGDLLSTPCTKDGHSRQSVVATHKSRHSHSEGSYCSERGSNTIFHKTPSNVVNNTPRGQLFGTRASHLFLNYSTRLCDLEMAHQKLTVCARPGRLPRLQYAAEILNMSQAPIGCALLEGNCQVEEDLVFLDHLRAVIS